MIVTQLYSPTTLPDSNIVTQIGIGFVVVGFVSGIISMICCRCYHNDGYTDISDF